MKLLNCKTKTTILLTLLLAISIFRREETLMADGGTADSSHTMNFTNSILGGLADVSKDTIESYKFCQRNPDAQECVQRRLASVRNVEASMQMLEAMNKSDAITAIGRHKKDDLQSELEEVQAINQMCTQEPNSFVCALVRDLIASKIGKKDRKVFISGVASKDY